MKLVKYIYLLFFISISYSCKNNTDLENKVVIVELKSIVIDTVIDSNLSEIQVSNKLSIPKDIYNQLTLVNVTYYGYDNLIHRGQIVCNKKVVEDVKVVFSDLYKIKFPIKSVKPMSFFNWDDDLSMQNNNTSCFNYRKVTNSKRLSEHSKGLAIDINPMVNPYISSKGIMSPKNGDYKKSNKGTITNDSDVIKVFDNIGWKWGGNWKRSKDYQHFSQNGR